MVLGFDGSETSDFTCIKGETLDGFLFTPRFLGDESRPTIWNPSDHPGNRMPRHEVDAAVDWLFGHYDVHWMFCDPPLWDIVEIPAWKRRHGDDRVLPFPTFSAQQMHPALEQFVMDVQRKRITHDGCPITTAHVRNARMYHRRDARYVLQKPDAARKIDAAVTSVVAHQAADRARAAGWGSSDDLPPLVFGV